MENEYLMTDKNLQSIDMKEILYMWRLNASNSPMSNSEASYSAQVYYQYKANGEFQTSGKSLKLWEGKKEKALIDFSQVPEFKITNKVQESIEMENIYAVKVLIKQTLTDEKTKQKTTNQFDIIIRRNKGAIIMEKYNPESNKFELVQTEIYTNYENEGKRYHIIKNLKTDSYGRHSYTVGIYEDTNCPSESDLIKSIAVDESSVSDFFSHHIGKTILFLLAAVALILTWYFTSSLIPLILIAVPVVAFVTFLIFDEKKNFLPPPKKIFCGLISSEKDDDPFIKEKEKKEPRQIIKEKEKKEPRQKTGKESEISD